MGRAFRSEDTAHAKALGQAQAWSFGGIVRRPRRLEQSEGKREEGKAERGWRRGRVPHGPVGSEGIWAFTRPEDWVLTQVLVGAPRWLLQGGRMGSCESRILGGRALGSGCRDGRRGCGHIPATGP